MAVTLAIDEHLVAEAQRVAASRGTSLEGLVAEFLQRIVQPTPEEFGRRLRQLTAEGRGVSGGARLDRSALHDRSDLP